MVNAGRVAPLPKGAWNGTTTYTMLDIVTYNDIAWIAKRDSLGQTPGDNAYWQRFGSSAPIATTSTAGIVIPDGTTIAVAADGTISVMAKLGDLANVELTDLASGQVIAYNATTQKWINVDISTTLAGLEDVDLEGVQDGQIIAYNATTHKWEPIDPPSSQKSEILIDYDPAEMTGITVTLAHAASAEGHTPESYQVTLDNTGEIEQDVINLGLWTITWTHEGQSYSEEFDVHYYGYFHIVLHEGFTWRLWATVGGIPINQYNSLSQLLADGAAVRRLFLVHNAVDYMCGNANSTQNQDLIAIINNGLCAKWANLSDYALDHMEADAVLSDLMDDADLYGYGELIEDNGSYVPKGNVPVMTSNTAPYGQVSTSTDFSSSYAGYMAFNSQAFEDSDTWQSNGNTNQYLRYKFVNPVNVRKVKFYPTMFPNQNARVKQYKIQASNDGTTWVDLTQTLTAENTRFSTNSAVEQDVDIENSNYYLYYQVYVMDNYTGYACAISWCQFYGRELKVSVPTMTSDTAPYGEASASNTYSVYYPYYPFSAYDDTASSVTHMWQVNENTGWLQYHFVKPVVISTYKICQPNTSSRTCTIKLQGSNDGSIWTDLDTTNIAIGDNIRIRSFSNNTSYEYYRFDITSTDNYIVITKAQFYGKDYSEKEFANDGSKWLYDHGVELEEITQFINGGGSVTPMTKNSDNIYIVDDSSGAWTCMHTGSIDLSDFNLMRLVSGHRFSGSSVEMGYSNSTSFVDDAYVTINTSQLPNHVSFDVSAVNQTKYPVILPANTNANTGYIEVVEWWLE